jgi:hypothetical protein
MLDLFKKVYKYHKRKVIAFIRNINFNLELFYEKNFSDCASILEDASQIFPDDKPLQILQEKNLQELIKDANADLDAKFALSLELDNK